MPGFKMHTAVSLILGIVLYIIYNLGVFYVSVNLFSDAVATYEQVFLLFITVLVFGLFPDIDTKSVGGAVFFPLFFIMVLIFILVGNYRVASFLGLFGLLPAVGKHRGWTHHVLSALLLPFLMTLIPVVFYDTDLFSIILPYSVAGTLSYLGHLILDGELL
ncbi:MAG: metal-dependent hydrolase [Fibrobacterota bacterium]